MSHIKKYIAEATGTFALVFCGTGSVILNDATNGGITQLGIALSFGLIVTAMIYAFGKTSGAHINPAVSISFSLTNVFDRTHLIPYIIAQLIGAIIASLLLCILFPANEYLGATIPAGSWQQSFILEFGLTYFLMFVILWVSQNEQRKKYTALAVGAVVGLEAYFAGPICGASMNPARSIAPALVSGHLEHLWIYILSTTLGAILATLSWKYLKR